MSVNTQSAVQPLEDGTKYNLFKHLMNIQSSRSVQMFTSVCANLKVWSSKKNSCGMEREDWLTPK